MTDLALDEVAERLMRMDPARPGVGRLAQELVAAVGGLVVKPDRAAFAPGRRLWVPRLLA